jgi:hypothetical protein
MYVLFTRDTNEFIPREKFGKNLGELTRSFAASSQLFARIPLNSKTERDHFRYSKKELAQFFFNMPDYKAHSFF